MSSDSDSGDSGPDSDPDSDPDTNSGGLKSAGTVIIYGV